MSSVIQLDLFDHVAMAYGQTKSGRLSNEDLYKMAVGRAGHEPKVLEDKVPIGIAKSPRSLVQRAIRWHQQTLRAQGLITKVSGVRGVWELTQSGKEKLKKIKSGAMVLGFSTDLGIAVWGSCIDVFSNLDEPICLALTSPPYPLRAPRAYGNPTIEKYIDFMCEILEPIVKNLVTGWNIALSVSQDIFESNACATSDALAPSQAGADHHFDGLL